MQKLVALRDTAAAQAACAQLGSQLQQTIFAARALASLGAASRTEDATGAPVCSCMLTSSLQGPCAQCKLSHAC